jgi:hypothetical protein
MQPAEDGVLRRTQRYTFRIAAYNPTCGGKPAIPAYAIPSGINNLAAAMPGTKSAPTVPHDDLVSNPTQFVSLRDGVPLLAAVTDFSGRSSYG